MERNVFHLKNGFYAAIDGARCKTWKDFFKNIGIAFNFPDYYGQNIHAFRDFMNDLSWINSTHYVLEIKNSKDLLSLGSQKDNYDYIKKEFESIARNWRLGPNAEGNDETRPVTEFNVIYK